MHYSILVNYGSIQKYTTLPEISMQFYAGVVSGNSSRLIQKGFGRAKSVAAVAVLCPATHDLWGVSPPGALQRWGKNGREQWKFDRI